MSPRSSSLYSEPPFMRLPKADLGRRMMASGIDFLLVWLLSYVGFNSQGGIQLGQWIVFLVVWGIFRVLVASKNQGQSPGHWALNMTVVDQRSAKHPSLENLLKREAVAGGASLLLLIGLSTWGLALLVLVVPLAIDCGSAAADPDRLQTLHDRLGQTIVVQTRRGYFLDNKVRQVLAQVQQRMR